MYRFFWYEDSYTSVISRELGIPEPVVFAIAMFGDDRMPHAVIARKLSGLPENTTFEECCAVLREQSF